MEHPGLESAPTWDAGIVADGDLPHNTVSVPKMLNYIIPRMLRYQLTMNMNWNTALPKILWLDSSEVTTHQYLDHSD